MDRKLYRSRQDRMVAGVCGGLAAYLDVDPTLVRVATVLLAALTQGAVLVAYVVMAIVVPEDPAEDTTQTDGSIPGPRVVVEEGDVTVAEEQVRSDIHKRTGAGFGILLVVIGAVLFANQLFPSVNVWRYFWPVLVIVAGVAVLLKGLKR